MIAMKAIYRRSAGSLLALLAAFPVATGCESLGPRRLHRGSETRVSRDSSALPADENETSQIQDVMAEPSKPKPFFKSSRLPGGLSDEAREIESHVGIR